MRPSVVAAILGFALVVLAAIFFHPRFQRDEPPDSVRAKTPAVAQTITSASPLQSPSPSPSASAPRLPNYQEPVAAVPSVIAAPSVAATPVAVQPTNHAAYVHDRVTELMALAMNDDSNSLNTIWSELSNPDKDIRAGALAAVVQFDDASVVPRLRELATQTEDSSEKAAIVAAADYLALPSMTDLPQALPTPPRKPRRSQ